MNIVGERFEEYKLMQEKVYCQIFIQYTGGPGWNISFHRQAIFLFVFDLNSQSIMELKSNNYSTESYGFFLEEITFPLGN